jgi:hypothetical protein
VQISRHVPAAADLRAARKESDLKPIREWVCWAPMCFCVALLFAWSACGSPEANPTPLPFARTNLFEGPERAAAFVEVARLREIQKRHVARVLAQPSVTAMGIGTDPASRRLTARLLTASGLLLYTRRG